MIKTSIRFFDDIPERAAWDEQSSKRWFCTADIAEVLTKSKNSRSYWNAVKRRKSELWTICRQLKLTASDGKKYRTDVVDEDGINTLIALVPSNKSVVFKKWLTEMGTTIDENSKQKSRGRKGYLFFYKECFDNRDRRLRALHEGDRSFLLL